MATEQNDTELRALLQGIASSAEPARTVRVNEVIERLAADQTLEVWGRAIARRYASSGIDWEDATSTLTIGLIRKLHDLTPETFNAIRMPILSRLYYWAKDAVSDWADSSAVTLAQGMVGISRRHRSAQKKRQEMVAALGREVTPAEVVEAYNSDVLAHRTNAAKQGEIIDVGDVTGVYLRRGTLVEQRPDDPYADGDWFVSEADTGEEDLETASEVASTMQLLERDARCQFDPPHSETVVQTLQVWSQIVLAGETPSARAVAKVMHVSRDRAGDLLRDVNGLLEAFRERGAVDA